MLYFYNFYSFVDPAVIVLNATYYFENVYDTKHHNVERLWG
jgi:hypothetical protein